MEHSISKDKKAFHWRHFLVQLLTIATPIALQNLMGTAAGMVDTMMVAPLGTNAVGALGLCVSFNTLLSSSYWGFVGGGMLFLSQYYGADDKDGVERAYGITWTSMMAVALMFCLAAHFAPEMVMKLYTDKAAIQAIGIDYLEIVGFAYLFQVFSMAVSCLLRTTERVRIPLIASILSTLVNIFLNWVFIYGHLGAPAMGIRGAAMATLVAAIVNLAALYIMAVCTRYPYLLSLRNHFRWSGSFFKQYYKKCFPIICNEVFMGVSNMIISMTLGRQDEPVIAAVAVFRLFEGIIYGFFSGFTNASSILVGTCVGAGELDTAYERARRLVYLCSGVIAVVGCIAMAAHTPLLHAMGLTGESFTAGTVLIGIYLAVAIIRMGNWIHNDTFRAAGDAVFGTLLEIFAMYLVVLPCVLLAAFYFHAPYWVVFLCCYIDEPIRYIFMQRHLYSGKWIKPVTEQGRAALGPFMESLKMKRA